MSTKKLFLVLGFVVSVGCGGAVTESEVSLSDAIVAGGFTCANISRMSVLSAMDTMNLRGDLIARLGSERFLALVQKRESCTSPGGSSTGNEIVSERRALSGSWNHEFIEQGSYGHSGASESGIYRDDSTNKICGGEWPYDYILKHRIDGASKNRDKIKISPQNRSSWCYFKNPSDARVYESDDVLTCVGYWRVFGCPVSVPPQYGDTRIWLDK